MLSWAKEELRGLGLGSRGQPPGRKKSRRLVISRPHAEVAHFGDVCAEPRRLAHHRQSSDLSPGWSPLKGGERWGGLVLGLRKMPRSPLSAGFLS